MNFFNSTLDSAILNFNNKRIRPTPRPQLLRPIDSNGEGFSPLYRLTGPRIHFG
jgi:hypothetical protein